MNNYHVSEMAAKYYDDLQDMVEDLASKCLGEEECTLHFPSGKITITLK